jgi:hypothetical protein
VFGVFTFGEPYFAEGWVSGTPPPVEYHFLLSELAYYIETQGLAARGTNLFYGPMKEFYPDTVVLLNEYGGLLDEPDEGAAEGRVTRLEYPRAQVRVRGPRNDFNTPWNLAEAIRAALVSIEQITIQGAFYVSIEALQPPFPLRVDENQRQEIVFNVEVTKRLSVN